MKKRVLAMLLASTMVLSMAACGGNDTVETTPVQGGDTTESSAAAEEFKMDKITAVVNGTVFTQENYRQEFEDKLSEIMGVDLDFNQQDHSGYADAVGRIFAGGADFDVILLSSEMYFAYASAGALYDITDLYENSKTKARLDEAGVDTSSALYIDGRLYGFSTGFGGGCVTYIKQAWLDAVGMEVPTNYEEFLAVCDAFVNQDPDGNGVKDTYAMSYPGFMGGTNMEAPYVNYCPEFWQDAYPDIYQKDGVWVDGMQEQSMIDALTRLQDAYQAGYIDPASLTNGTKDARNNFYEDKSGIFTYWAGKWNWNLMTNLEANGLSTDLVVLPPLEGVIYYDRTPGAWAINANATPEEAKFIWDHFMESFLDGGEGEETWAYGVEGYHWSTAAETVKWGDNEATYAEGEFHMLPSKEQPDTLYTAGHLDPNALAVPILEGKSTNRVLGEDVTTITECNQLFYSWCEPAPLPPISDTYQAYKGDLTTAKATVLAEVVINGMDAAEAIQKLYVDQVGAQAQEILDELN